MHVSGMSGTIFLRNSQTAPLQPEGCEYNSDIGSLALLGHCISHTPALVRVESLQLSAPEPSSIAGHSSNALISLAEANGARLAAMDFASKNRFTRLSGCAQLLVCTCSKVAPCFQQESTGKDSLQAESSHKYSAGKEATRLHKQHMTDHSIVQTRDHASASIQCFPLARRESA